MEYWYNTLTTNSMYPAFIFWKTKQAVEIGKEIWNLVNMWGGVVGNFGHHSLPLDKTFHRTPKQFQNSTDFTGAKISLILISPKVKKESSPQRMIFEFER